MHQPQHDSIRSEPICVGQLLLIRLDSANSFAVCLPHIQGHKLYFEGSGREAPPDVAAATFVVRRPGHYDNSAKLRKLQRSADGMASVTPGKAARHRAMLHMST